MGFEEMPVSQPVKTVSFLNSPPNNEQSKNNDSAENCKKETKVSNLLNTLGGIPPGNVSKKENNYPFFLDQSQSSNNFFSSNQIQPKSKFDINKGSFPNGAPFLPNDEGINSTNQESKENKDNHTFINLVDYALIAKMLMKLSK